MNLQTGIYSFRCEPMFWTAMDLGLESGDGTIMVSIELSEEEVQALAMMTKWAWDKEWFEDNTSETASTELMQKMVPSVYRKVYPLAHQQFCHAYPNSEWVAGYGVYEIFVTDEIVCLARESYKK